MKSYRILAEDVANWMARAALRMRGERVIVLHNHIFKNAGSTIDWALENYFRKAFVDHRDDDLMRQGASYLGSYLSINKHITALSSHHLTMPLPELANVRLLMIMMFRHPIERVISAYNFERDQISDTHPGVIHARKYSLRDYILWRMRPEVGPTIRNFQVRKMLPPRKIGQEKISADEMSKATNQLKEIELLGLVGRFDESMVLFEECLSRIFPQIDLSYIAQNVSREASLTQEARLERLRETIGDEIYDVLLENNQQDIQLLSFAEEEVESRISKIDGFVEKLENFRARCAAKAE